ncbi:SNF2-related protein [Vibrio brasiliensis]|uniref:protein DpdE n=1 Tax=Vibrio brasiliensis TaxID=170652 RepID=UPI001EFCDAF4|nr:protein DpdE [Vibrio brasiliensis]MCG9751344.1 SNF2-related protein [Vibrio brasiliensis]
MSSVRVGSLVKSSTAFSGIGKILSINAQEQSATIGFFASPFNPHDAQIEVSAQQLLPVTSLQNKSIVFCKVGTQGRWKLGFYEGERPGEKHLVEFSREFSDEFAMRDLYVPNAQVTGPFKPHEYLKAKGTVTPFLTEARAQFYQHYLAQRAACQSMSSILGSAVEFEAHQLAVVSRVLSDSKRKYLLCDEVGLGKTIEAGLILRHHVMEKGRDARVFVLTPGALTHQWQRELTDRFHLGDVLALASDELEASDDTQLVFLGSYRDVTKLSQKIGKPTMIVVDEAHQFAEFGWSDQFVERFCFDALAEASEQAEISLLLTGTPLIGQEKNYLAMLHCLERGKYPLTTDYVDVFKAQIQQQAHYIGLYRALDPAKDNDILEGVLNDIKALDLDDDTLASLIEIAEPLVDFFAEEDDIDADERADAIMAVRNYFADRYTLNYRMLRNRRDSSNGAEQMTISHLFPGLGACDFVTWDLPEGETLQDQQLDDLRSAASRWASGDVGKVDAEKNHAESVYNVFGLAPNEYLDWLEAMMQSPRHLASKITQRLNTHTLDAEQHAYWQGILDIAEQEQHAKDAALQQRLIAWLAANPDGKAVVFCGERSVADHVQYTLSDQLSVTVERHNPAHTPQFTSQPDVRVLVCDERGEDGLNLQGRQRLAVHYTLPLAVNRIEQRNGRLNRYSAFMQGSQPIETCVLVPNRDGFYRQWAQLLRDGIGAFEHYRASIQEPIDGFLTQGWQGLWEGGFAHITTLAEQLGGARGLVAQELRKLEIQDAMDRDMLDVRAALSFAQRIEQNDANYEQSTNELLDWMIYGLLFEKSHVEYAEQFQLQFVHHRTRLDVDNLIRHCIIGLDFEHSTYSAPVTHPMSPNRTLCAQTGAYPLRYGQPFVDSVATMSGELPLGLASAYLRKVKAKLGDSQLCFKTQWAVSLDTPEQSVFEQLQRDQQAAPLVVSDIFHGNGNVMKPSPAKSLMAVGYNKKLTPLDLGSMSVMYSDQNIALTTLNGELIDVWDYIEREYDQRHWQEMIDCVYERSREHALTTFAEQYPAHAAAAQATLLTIQAVILVGEG